MTRIWFDSKQVDLAQYTDMSDIPMDTSKIKSITWLHKTGTDVGYLKTTVQISSVSEIDNNWILTFYVPVSFVVHPESSIHIGMCTLVHGSVLSLSLKQKSSGKVHWRLDSLGLITRWRLICWWNISALLYDTFISLIDSYQETLAELSTSQLSNGK